MSSEIDKLQGEALQDYDKKSFEEDCPKYNYFPTILPQRKRIIAIGDLHGDYKLTLDCLKLAKVIDNNNTCNAH